jgi:carbamoyltransferase
MDSSGVRPEACSLYARGDGLNLSPLYCPGLMIGNAYYYFTALLGLGDGLFKAGSTMGLAAYGKPSRHPDHAEFLTNFFERTIRRDDQFMSMMWAKLSGLGPSQKMREIDQKAMDVAATLQMIFEDATLEAARHLHREIEHLHGNNLCLSGGSFLNCNANTRIARESGFENLHLFPGCGDDGTAVGSALYVAHHLLREPRARYEPRQIAYLGKSYGEIPHGRKLDLDVVAQAIHDGKVVGWLQGGSEFGPRALGHRSILADPRSPTMRDHINFQVKHREWFRPFAPAVLAEKSQAWFEFGHASPFMLHTAQVKEPEKIPAVTHVDHSARMQTVNQDDNPLFYDLIRRFEQLTGVPMILNTSFNLDGEPLVESPEDAMRTFSNSRLDLLVMEQQMYLK